MTAASTYTQALAEFTAAIRPDDLPQSAVKAAKRVILDTLGCAVAGATADSTPILTKVISSQGGTPEATMLSNGLRVPATKAAYVNAQMANALDADDDLHYKAHVAAAVIPPALAMAERQRASGMDLITSVAAGYELAARIGMSLKGLMITPSGELQFAPITGYSWCGFGAAASTGWLLHLDAEKMRHTIGITGVTIPLPASTQHSEKTGRAMTKYAMYGTLVEAGMMAALLAEAGFTGLPAILDGEKGLWKVLGSIDVSWDALTERLGKRWFVEETSFKLYPACRFTNAASDLYYALAAEHGFTAEDVEHVHVELIGPALAKKIDDGAVETQVDGQFSMPYIMAVTALGITPGPQWHSRETRAREDVKAFASKVSVGLEPTASAVTAEDISKYGHARRLPATVEVRAKGKTYKARAEYSLGDVYTAETTLSDARLEAKFRDFCAGLLSPQQIEDAIATVWNLDNEPNMDRLVASVTPRPA